MGAVFFSSFSISDQDARRLASHGQDTTHVQRKIIKVPFVRSKGRLAAAIDCVALVAPTPRLNRCVGRTKKGKENSLYCERSERERAVSGTMDGVGKWSVSHRANPA